MVLRPMCLFLVACLVTGVSMAPAVADGGCCCAGGLYGGGGCVGGYSGGGDDMGGSSDQQWVNQPFANPSEAWGGGQAADDQPLQSYDRMNLFVGSTGEMRPLQESAPVQSYQDPTGPAPTEPSWASNSLDAHTGTLASYASPQGPSNDNLHVGSQFGQEPAHVAPPAGVPSKWMYTGQFPSPAAVTTAWHPSQPPRLQQWVGRVVQMEPGSVVLQTQNRWIKLQNAPGTRVKAGDLVVAWATTDGKTLRVDPVALPRR